MLGFNASNEFFHFASGGFSRTPSGLRPHEILRGAFRSGKSSSVSAAERNHPIRFRMDLSKAAAFVNLSFLIHFHVYIHYHSHHRTTSPLNLHHQPVSIGRNGNFWDHGNNHGSGRSSHGFQITKAWGKLMHFEILLSFPCSIPLSLLSFIPYSVPPSLDYQT